MSYHGEYTMNRRSFISLAVSAASTLAISTMLGGMRAMAEDTKVDRLTKTKEEWHKTLSDIQYNVLREEGTEAPFSSPLNEEKHAGMFVCAGCGLELFPSKYKYNSGTGWPSFYDAIPGHIETRRDTKLFAERTEYHCARCGGHQGHVFEDGPQPTGLRYCNNGVAIRFIPEKA
jgi:peptide-methionine (R)-S-oxide reductase